MLMRHLLCPLLLLLLSACGDKDGDPGDDTGSQDTALPDVPYLSDDGDTEEALSFDADDVAVAVEAALVAARQIDASPVLGAYMALMEGADAGCPQWTTYEGYPTWLDACTSDAGVRFDGYGVLVEWEGAELDGSGIYWSGMQLFSAASLQSASGDTLTLNGEASLLYGSTGTGINAFISSIGGPTRWEGAQTDTWLDWGITPQIYLMAYHEPISDTKVVQLGGSIEIEDGGPVSVVVLDGLYLLQEPTGTLCGQEPSGTISLLDSEGRWFDLIFDGPTEAQPETDMDLCDGCAQAWFRGRSIGEACIDFSSLTDWQSHPWE